MQGGDDDDVDDDDDDVDDDDDGDDYSYGDYVYYHIYHCDDDGDKVPQHHLAFVGELHFQGFSSSGLVLIQLRFMSSF